jgi:cell division protein FtsZ
MQQVVDTLIIIPNQNLFRIATERTTFADAFKMADDVLYAGVRGVTDLMMKPGLINLDFADIRTVMSEMGKAMMGTGEAEGDKRAIDAAEAAISNPLLDDTSMKGARGVLINITGGMDMTLFEVDEAANRIRDEVDHDANIIFGSTFDEKLNGKMRVSVVATGSPQPPPKPTVISGDSSPAGQPAPRRGPDQAPSSVPRPPPSRLSPLLPYRALPQPVFAAAVVAAQVQPELDIGRPEPVARPEPVVRTEAAVRAEIRMHHFAPTLAPHRPRKPGAWAAAHRLVNLTALSPSRRPS